jgi:ParB-like chromosome segregation protein Spo0J
MSTSVEKDEAAPSKPAKVIFHGNIAINKIHASPQVRKKFDENAHKELTESVRTKGIINPVTLRPHPKKTRPPG